MLNVGGLWWKHVGLITEHGKCKRTVINTCRTVVSVNEILNSCILYQVCRIVEWFWPYYNCRTVSPGWSQRIWQVTSDDICIESAWIERVILLAWDEILQSVPKNVCHSRTFVSTLPMGNMICPRQVLHSKLARGRILNALSHSHKNINLLDPECWRVCML